MLQKLIFFKFIFLSLLYANACSLQPTAAHSGFIVLQRRRINSFGVVNVSCDVGMKCIWYINICYCCYCNALLCISHLCCFAVTLLLPKAVVGSLRRFAKNGNLARKKFDRHTHTLTYLHTICAHMYIWCYAAATQ